MKCGFISLRSDCKAIFLFLYLMARRERIIKNISTAIPNTDAIRI